MLIFLPLSIIVAVGIISALRRASLKRLGPAEFPNVASDSFEEWRSLELRSIDVFLKFGIASVLLFGLMYVFCLVPGLELLCGLLVNMGLLPVAFCVLFLVGLILWLTGKVKATKLKRSLGLFKSKAWGERHG